MASLLQQAAMAIRMNDYVTLITLTAVGYDYILTFSKEIEYIWNKPWTRVSTLFVFARYFGLCGVFIYCLWGTSFMPLSEQTTCERVPSNVLKKVHSAQERFQGVALNILGEWTTLMFLCAAELAMILRVWALHGQSRFILGTLLALYAVEIVPDIVLCIKITVQPDVGPVAQVLGYTLCQYGYVITPVWALLVDGAQITLGALMCFLVAIRFVKQSFQMYKATQQFSPNRYLKLLAREGIFYFLAALTYSVINMLFYEVNIPMNGFGILLQVTQTVPIFTLVPRLILSLRELYARDLRDVRGGDIDTAFGFASAVHTGTIASAIAFADGRQNEGEEGCEDMQMEDICTAGGGA